MGNSEAPSSKIQKEFNQCGELSFDFSMFFHSQVISIGTMCRKSKSIFKEGFLFNCV